MRVDLFNFDLPPERIAQEALEPRDAARLLVLPRQGTGSVHRTVRDLPDFLRPGDLLVLNDTRVLAARLLAKKPTGGKVEILLLEPAREPGSAGPNSRLGAWWALIGASHVPRPGVRLDLGGGFSATLLAGPGPGGRGLVELDGAGTVEELMAQRGRLPLPPYIRRAAEDPRTEVDSRRYQTVFAETPGALAAPTAGLHFTPDLLARLRDQGVEQARVTLHVGEGTFRPVTVSDVERIVLHPERFDLPPATAEAVAATRRRGGRVVAVGTTVVRTLESCLEARPGVPVPGSGSTSLFIQPGHRFRFVDALVTNFHLPCSTLLMLVAAFAGRERVLAAYAEAIRLGYRFYSYGDAMLIL